MTARNESQRCASEVARLEGEARTLREENEVLVTELRTLEEARPAGSGVRVGCGGEG